MSLLTTEEIDWDYLINSLQEQKCVLMLGPELPKTLGGKPLYKALLDNLGVASNNNIRYYEDDDLFGFSGTQRVRTYVNIKKFYSQEHYETVQEKIAQIPFHLTISISPDLILKKVFDKQKYPYEFAFYKKGVKPEDVEEPTIEMPLLYNLFGSITDVDSLIFTHDDMFEFLFGVLKDKPLPNQLMNELKEARNYVFLGFKFEKWYLKMLLRLFNLHEGDDIRYAASDRNEGIQPNIENFYNNHFKVNFIDANIEDFLDQLYERCEAENMLRKQRKIDVSNQLITYVAKNKVENVISYLYSSLEQKSMEDGNFMDLFSDIVLISGTYSDLKDRKSKLLISGSDELVEMNKIKQALLELIKKLRTLA